MHNILPKPPIEITNEMIVGFRRIKNFAADKTSIIEIVKNYIKEAEEQIQQVNLANSEFVNWEEEISNTPNPINWSLKKAAENKDWKEKRETIRILANRVMNFVYDQWKEAERMADEREKLKKTEFSDETIQDKQLESETEAEASENDAPPPPNNYNKQHDIH